MPRQYPFVLYARKRSGAVVLLSQDAVTASSVAIQPPNAGPQLSNLIHPWGTYRGGATGTRSAERRAGLGGVAVKERVTEAACGKERSTSNEKQNVTYILNP